jgi:hypothetical protein
MGVFLLDVVLETGSDKLGHKLVPWDKWKQNLKTSILVDWGRITDKDKKPSIVPGYPKQINKSYRTSKFVEIMYSPQCVC